MRPCRHALAAIKVASALVGLPQYQNVIDHRWLGTVGHLQTWRAQHTGVVKRVSFAGHEAQLKQEKPYCAEDASQAGPHVAVYAANVSRVRHVGPLRGQLSQANIVQQFQMKRQNAIEAANALAIDLTNERQAIENRFHR